MNSTNETNTNNLQPRGSSGPEAHQPPALTAEALQAQLSQFTGTENYYSLGPLFRRAVFTDGVHFLVENAQCMWLITDSMAWVTSKIPGTNYDDGFFTVELHPKANGSADLMITDGNGTTLHQQKYQSHSFPMAKGIKLFAQWGGDFWVLMLTSEY